MMELTIRRATADDATVVALLAQITFKEAFGHVWDTTVRKNYFRSTFNVLKMRSSIVKANNVFLIAYADELPVGYAKLKLYSPYEKLEDKKPAQLQKIYVLNDYIGNKIGEQLLTAVFAEVKKNKVHTLWLAVWDANDKGIKFYERHGFVCTTKYHYDYERMSFDYEVMTKQFA